MKEHTVNMDKFQGFIGGAENIHANSKEDKSRLEYYKKLMESGETITMAFSNQEWKEGLWKKDKGLTVWLENEELSFGDGTYLRDSALTRHFTVKIIRVDEETKTVYTSFRHAKKEREAEVIAMINAALKKKEKLIVPARVVWFDKNRKATHCYLDILGVGIRGVMGIDHWSYDYDESFADLIRIGDVVSVAITGFAKDSKKDAPKYLCSRKETLEPVDVVKKKWDKAESLFKQNSRVVVRCRKKHDKNFEAEVLGYKGWVAYCHYPEETDKLKILEGMAYRGWVKSVSGEKRILRVNVIEMVPESVASDI